MKRLQLKDPSARIVLSGGRGDIHNGSSDKEIKELIESNPNYAQHFHEVEVEESKPVAEEKKK